MKRLLLAAIAAVLLVAPAADAKAFRATVIKRNAATKTVVVATKSGKLRIVHNRRDRVGTVLRINGTHVKAVAHASRVHIKGVVTRKSAKSFNVSAAGAVVKVRARSKGRVARRHGHQLGQGLNVTAKVSSNGTITEIASADTDDVDGAEIKGVLTCTPTSDPAACDLPNTLKIDVGSAGAPNLIPIVFDPALFPDTQLGPLVGQQVEARASLAASANDPGAVVLTLTAIDSEGVCQAEDDGDDNGGAGGNGGNGGNGGGDDSIARHHGGDGCEDDD